MIDFSAFISSSLLALCLGALIGLERERTSSTIVGLRTFALVSFLGFMATAIGSSLGFVYIVTGVGFLGTFVFAFLYYYFRALHEKAIAGLTTALSLPLTYLLGVLIGMGYSIEAVASAIAIALLLVERQKLHDAVKKVTIAEIVDGLIFAVIAFVIYPLLPSKPQLFLGYTIDLQLVWKIIVVGSLLSFGAHLLTKYLREKGALLAAFFGGAVSSLGIVYLFIRSVSRNPPLVRLALVTSSAGAYAADVVLLFFIAPQLLTSAGLVAIAATLVLFVFTWLYSRETKFTGTVFSKPLSLAFVAEFALLFFLINFLSGFLISSFGETGLLLSSLIGGAVSSSAVFASVVALFAQGSVTAKQASLSMLLGLTGSMAVKTFLVGRKLNWREPVKIILPALASLVVGFIVFLVT
ncbi:MAG: DUF4010 domain-containing protein [Candidatus Micrarchaeota archaeon]